MRRASTFAAILAFVFLAACAPQQPARPPQSTSSGEAASSGLATLRKLVNANNYRSMGFESQDEVNSGSLGDPLHVFLVRLDLLRQFQPGGDSEKLLSDIGEELYPVLVNGAPRSAVLVEKQGEQWSPVSYGGANLVKALAQRRAGNSAMAKAAAPTYFEVHVAALNMYFLGYRQETKFMLIPVIDDPKYKFAAGTPVPAAEAFAALVPAAKAVPMDKPL
ncbi:MAG: hypothetical protein LAO23_22765 [Acidobacteriia bacterium]|nr:hypothetical protein [Terriglobia bacterium]